MENMTLINCHGFESVTLISNANCIAMLMKDCEDLNIIIIEASPQLEPLSCRLTWMEFIINVTLLTLTIQAHLNLFG